MTDFATWYKKFVQDRQGVLIKDPEYWAKLVDESHQNIRNLISGEKAIFQVDIPQGYNTANMSVIKPYVDMVCDYAGGLNFLKPYNLDENVFLSKEVNYRDKKYPLSTFISKAIEKYYKAQNRLLPYYVFDAIKATVDNIAYTLSGSTTKELKATVCISTTPMAFMLLGSYGCDSDSCWRQGTGINQSRKYTYGVQKDTFVMTVLTDQGFEEIPDHLAQMIRSVGFLGKTHDAVNTYNYYARHTYGCIPNYRYLTGHIGQKIRGWKDIGDVHQGKISVSGGGLYSNNNHLTALPRGFDVTNQYINQCLIAEEAYPTLAQT